MAMLLALLLLVVPLAHGVAPFSTPPHMSSKHPAFSVLTPAAAQGGLVARLGTGEKTELRQPLVHAGAALGAAHRQWLRQHGV